MLMQTHGVSRTIRQLRLSKHLSLDQLSELSGAPKATLWEMENRPHKMIGVGKINAVAKVFEMDWEDVLEMEDRIFLEKEQKKRAIDESLKKPQAFKGTV
jgi:transcriptional regulator with XRE-family HTH domain